MSPDGSTKPSPEERLLRLIRAKGPGASAANPVRQTAAAAAVIGGSGMSATAPALRWPVAVGGGLAMLLAIEIVYFVIQMARPLPPVHIPPVPDIPTTAPMTEPPPPVDVPQLTGSVSRPLFVSSLATGLPGTSTEPPKTAGPSTEAKDLAARLTLMGIVAGDPAQAVIEDSQTKKTYFVTAGQAVAEGAVLEQVLDNRVILNLNGEQISLSL